jgi:hypothetical protein
MQNVIQLKMMKAQLLNSKIKFMFKILKIKLKTILIDIIMYQAE